MIGEGVKQITAYKCHLPFDELEKLREEFWGKKNKLTIASKREYRRIWLTLKSCCETDACKLKKFIKIK
jgi:hypothetical protein